MTTLLLGLATLPDWLGLTMIGVGLVGLGLAAPRRWPK